jgi:hypothetical protein
MAARHEARRRRTSAAREEADILDIARAAGLHPRREYGDEYTVRCPLPMHADEDPSCYVNAAKQEWFCHVCQRGGGAGQFSQHLGRVQPLTSVRNTSAPSKPSKASQVDAARLWSRLGVADLRGRRALNRRFLGGATQADLLGFLTDQVTGVGTSDEYLHWLARCGYRIAVPLRDPHGKVVALALRHVERTADVKLRIVGTPAGAVFGYPERLRQHARVLIVEGWADWVAASLAYEGGETAVLGLRSASSLDEDTIAELFTDFDGEALLLPHNDDGGRGVMARLALTLTKFGRRWTLLPPASQRSGGDLADVMQELRGEVDDLRERLEKSVADTKVKGQPPCAELEKHAGVTRAPPSPRTPPPEWSAESLYCPPTQTALVSHRLLELVGREVGNTTERRRDARRRRGAVLTSVTRLSPAREGGKARRAADALLALKLDTLLRYMDRGRGAFASVKYLAETLRVSTKEVYAAAAWLEQHGVPRAQPTADDARRHWGVAQPRDEVEATNDYVPIPSMALLQLRPRDLFTLTLLCHWVEVMQGGDDADYRRELLPRHVYLSDFKGWQTTYAARWLGKRSLTASLTRLSEARYFSLKRRQLTPPKESALSHLRRRRRDDDAESQEPHDDEPAPSAPVPFPARSGSKASP